MEEMTSGPVTVTGGRSPVARNGRRHRLWEEELRLGGVGGGLDGWSR